MNRSWFFFLVLLIEGAALMAVELMGAKLVAPFYGSSLYVWTSVLLITVLGLTLGYFIGGKLSLKWPSEKLLIIILGVSALFVFALPATVSFLISYTSGFDLITGICTTGSLLLLPPMVCFGIVGPMVVRLMAIRAGTIGNTTGTVYSISTMGGLLATFLFGYYLIPEKGLKFSSMVTAFGLFFLVVIYLIKVLAIKKGEDMFQTQGAQKKINKTKSNGNTWKVKRSVYLFAMLEGATVMAIELIAARMISPYFGSTLYVWSAVIGFTVLGLALGYYFGGKLADKYTNLNTLLWVLLIASVFLMFMHYSSQQLTNAFMGTDMRIAVIILSLLLVLPPLLFLGMIPILLIRYLSATIDNAGSVAGTVFTISSASGIIALPLIGFYIIPEFGLTTPSIVIGIIAGTIPFLKLAVQKKYLSFVFLASVILSCSLKEEHRTKDDVDVIYYSEGLLGQVLVTDTHSYSDGISNINRSLFVNRFGESFVNMKTGNVEGEYIIYAAALASKLPENSNILILGLGGGAMANISHNGLKFNVDVVELDERIVEVSKNYFQLNKDVHVVVDDARHYIEKTNKKYDLVFFDVFRGDIPPANVYSLECFKKAKSLLNKDGMIMVNFFGFLNGNIGTAGRSVYKTLLAAGMNTKIISTPGTEEQRNLLFVATPGEKNFSNLRYPLKVFNNYVDIDTLFLKTENIDLKNAVVLTDDKPILDRLSMNVTDNWRAYFNKISARSFLENGIPLFK